jgi:hypothetical protein
MKKRLKDQDPRTKFQLHKETLKNLTGSVTLEAQPKTDPQAAPGTTDWTCTDQQTAWC